MLPFSEEQFLSVFARFNAALVIPIAGLWIITLAVLYSTARQPRPRLLAGLLVVHWLWSGAVYHWAHFTAINPAAWVFGLLFVVQACLFAWYGVKRGQLLVAWGTKAHQLAGAVFVAYGLAYPALVLIAGLRWPRMPAFGVPCPTTIMTLGLLLLLEPGHLRGLAVIPVLWAAVGGSAAALLGVPPDYALIVAGLAVLGYVTVPRRVLVRAA